MDSETGKRFQETTDEKTHYTEKKSIRSLGISLEFYV